MVCMGRVLFVFLLYFLWRWRYLQFFVGEDSGFDLFRMLRGFSYVEVLTGSGGVVAERVIGF